MALGIIIGTFLTTRLAAHVNSVYIAVFFALFMALIAALMFLNWKPRISTSPTRFHNLFLVGIGIGCVSALAAVGGGFLAVTYLSYKNIGIKNAIGTSAAIGLPIAVTGTVGYMLSGWSQTSGLPYSFGFIYIPAFLAISLASPITASYGASFAHSLPETHLKKIFAVLSLALSIKMLFSVVQH